MRFMTATARASYGEQGARSAPLIERLYASSGITRRHSVLKDYATLDAEGYEFFPKNDALEPFPSTARRLEAYERESVPLAEAAAKEALARSGFAAREVTHLIFTTCTGFFAPGPDLRLIARLGLRPQVRRTVVGFMGCYAGFNAMKLAGEAIAADERAVALCGVRRAVHIAFPEAALARLPRLRQPVGADGAAAAVFAAPARRARAAWPTWPRPYAQRGAGHRVPDDLAHRRHGF